MKRKTLMMIAVLIMSLLVGCGSANTTENEAGTEVEQTQKQENETEQETETHTHDYAEAITTEATCETNGLKTFTCECGDSYTEVITASGHIYENYIYNEDATYLADGTETATCNGCELTDTRTAEGSKLEYTFTDLDKMMYAKQNVNVRDLPSEDGSKLGGLSHAQEVHVTGQCTETNWYRIELDGGVGYVSDSYLQDAKPVQQTATQDTTAGTSTTNTSSDWYNNYEVGVWHDMGEYYFRIGNSLDEANAEAKSAQVTRPWETELISRYPDRVVFWASSCPDGIPVTMAVATIGYPNEPGFYRPTYIWE